MDLQRKASRHTGSCECSLAKVWGSSWTSSWENALLRASDRPFVASWEHLANLKRSICAIWWHPNVPLHGWCFFCSVVGFFKACASLQWQSNLAALADIANSYSAFRSISSKDVAPHGNDFFGSRFGDATKGCRLQFLPRLGHYSRLSFSLCGSNYFA